MQEIVLGDPDSPTYLDVTVYRNMDGLIYDAREAKDIEVRLKLYGARFVPRDRTVSGVPVVDVRHVADGYYDIEHDPAYLARFEVELAHLNIHPAGLEVIGVLAHNTAIYVDQAQADFKLVEATPCECYPDAPPHKTGAPYLPPTMHSLEGRPVRIIQRTNRKDDE